MINVRELKSHMALKDEKIPSLANKIGISKSAFYKKMRGESDFTRGEIINLINLLDINPDKTIEIFFKN